MKEGILFAEMIKRYIVLPTLICRLKIIKRELKEALKAEEDILKTLNQ